MEHHAKRHPDCHRVRFVSSFDELMSARFSGDINALCWARDLPGDFQAIIDRLDVDGGMRALGNDDLLALDLPPAGLLARDILLADLALLRDRGLAPSLDCITGYPRDVSDAPIATDVYSFHADSAPVAADTFLCTYIGATSEGLANECAIRRVDVAETRAQLLRDYNGPDDDDFVAYLRDNCFDLHYQPLPDARPFVFGVGNLWRIAIAYPGSPVLPCIHRAPLTRAGDPARLLLIS